MTERAEEDRAVARAMAVRLGAVYGAIFFIVGMQTAYLPAWLLSRGLTETGIAAALSIPMLVRVATTPLITVAADRFGQPGMAIVVLAWRVVGTCALLMIADGFWPILLTMIVFATFWTAIMPLTEALAMRGVRVLGLDYGRMRLWGSLTFIAAGLIGGWTLGEFGPWLVVPLMLVAALALAGAGHATAAMELPTATQSKGRERLGFRDLITMLRTRAFYLLLLASGLGQATHAVYYAFGTIHWQAIGLPATSIGILWSIGVVAEIILFMQSRRVLAVLSPAVLLALGIASGLLRWPLTALDPSFAVLCLVQTLHGLTFGAVHLGAIHMISDLVGEERAASAQGLHATFAAGVFMAAAIAASGPLYRMYAGGAYVAMAIVAALGTLAALALIRHTKAAPGAP